jgi:uracil-DNA glycosylase family 4
METILARKLADKAKNLTDLKRMIESFDVLEIKKTAINTVFARGNSKAKIMIIGEAPGEQEDKQGIPFCGRSGKLLDEMLLSSDINPNEQIYITNLVFWRPPKNRKPTSLESENCLPFVEKHISFINPDILILLGTSAAHALLKVTDPISNLRNKQFSYLNRYLEKGINTFVMFHPSYLLRKPSQKIYNLNDLIEIKKLLLL